MILREAIAEYGKAAGREVAPASQFASLIGVIGDGPGGLSERTGETFAGIVAAKERHPKAPAAKSVRARRKVH